MELRSLSRLLFISTLVFGTQAFAPFSLFRREGTDDQTLAYFAEVGQCYLYLETVDQSIREKKQLGPCQTYCRGQGKSKYKCNGYNGISTPDDVQDKDMIQYDDDGNIWIPSSCNCDEQDSGSGGTPTQTGGGSQTSVSPISTACQVCTDTGTQQTARKKRWGVMFARQDSIVDTCLLNVAGSSSDSSASKRGLNHLKERTTAKVVSVRIPGFQDLELEMGQYPESGEAKKTAGVEKVFGLTQSNCGPVMKQVPVSAIPATFDTETDHVYEAQTLANFFQWLASMPGQTLGNTVMPSADWVQNVLLHDDQQNTRLFKMGQRAGGYELGLSGNTLALDVILAIGFARSDGKGSTGFGMTKPRTIRGLALLQKALNGKKGKWFGGAVGNAIDGTLTLEQNDIELRIGAGVFSYLAFTPTIATNLVPSPDPIWNKWMRVSNWFDLVLYEFDRSYPWGGKNGVTTFQQGEPTRNDGQDPSLRGLYARFIDDSLTTIEANVVTWSANCRASLVQDFDFTTPQEAATRTASEIAWFNRAFDANTGWATGNSMRFPRPAGLNAGASVFGAYWNPDMTFDAQVDTARDLGAPLMP